MTAEDVDKMADDFVNAQEFTGVYSLARKAECGAFWKKGFLAGLEAGRPKWHDLRKDPDDLPEMLHPVHVKLDSGTYVFAYCVNGIWHGNDDGIILYHGDGRSEVIAWCEIPTFAEGVCDNN